MLHDFSFTPVEALLAKLKGGVGKGAMPMKPSDVMGGLGRGMGQMPRGEMMQGHAMPGMGAMDVNDIDYDAYLANDRTLNDPQVARVDKAGRVRLRIINGATATAFTIDTGALDGELIALTVSRSGPSRAIHFRSPWGSAWTSGCFCRRVAVRIRCSPGVRARRNELASFSPRLVLRSARSRRRARSRAQRWDLVLNRDLSPPIRLRRVRRTAASHSRSQEA
jgi:hypothetical protein